jgi:propanol-preferring alcohol dehydrogenase
VQYAKAMGMRTIAVDIGPDKGDLCREVGAEAYIDASACEDVAAEVKKITGYGGKLPYHEHAHRSSQN